MLNFGQSVTQLLQGALQHQRAGRLPQAEALYRQILQHDANHPDALHMLGAVALQTNRHEMAIALIRQAIAVHPNFPEAYFNLAGALKAHGSHEQAIDAYRRAVALKPDWAQAHGNLGVALHFRGRLDEALDSFRTAIALQPGFSDGHSNLGNVLATKGHYAEAIAAYRQAIALNPGHAEGFNNLGSALKNMGQLDEAIAAFRQAVILRPDFSEAMGNLGVALKDQGRLDDAIAAYRQSMSLKPDSPDAHSNLLAILHYHPQYDGRAIAEEHGRWNRQHAGPLKRFIVPHLNDRDSDRRLRIGYVSPDFREHVVGRNMLPLLREHDHQQVEIFCYSNGGLSDALTAQFQRYADGWRSIAYLTDAQAAERIREDRIDILVDLALHMAGGRLTLFARKPAPVQATFAGYPGTTGLDAIDYRLTDPYLDPADIPVGELYAETSIRLPDSFWCYDPLTTEPMSVNALPSAANGYITFGCLNNYCKVNDAVVQLWGQVLHYVADSHLMLLVPEGSPRRQLLEALQNAGIAPSRVHMHANCPRDKYLALYHGIDIGLDSFPYNGHTTSLDSLWMGVPVVTLPGSTVVGRAGVSQLQNLRLPELIAQGPADFVRIAMELAADIPRLETLRSALRTRMEASAIMNAPRFARNIETAYRDMWRRWCAAKG